MKNIKCPWCNGTMVMDEWNGWKLYCLSCSFECDATDDEIKEYEKEMYGEPLYIRKK